MERSLADLSVQSCCVFVQDDDVFDPTTLQVTPASLPTAIAYSPATTYHHHHQAARSQWLPSPDTSPALASSTLSSTTADLRLDSFFQLRLQSTLSSTIYCSSISITTNQLLPHCLFDTIQLCYSTIYLLCTPY